MVLLLELAPSALMYVFAGFICVPIVPMSFMTQHAWGSFHSIRETNMCRCSI
jgi:hypothetical protein